MTDFLITVGGLLGVALYVALLSTHHATRTLAPGEDRNVVAAVGHHPPFLMVAIAYALYRVMLSGTTPG